VLYGYTKRVSLPGKVRWGEAERKIQTSSIPLSHLPNSLFGLKIAWGTMYFRTDGIEIIRNNIKVLSESY
jgi:hypothetical protein